MKYLLDPKAFYPLVSLGITLDYVWEIEWIGNISMFAIWTMTTLTVLSLWVDSKFFTYDKKKRAVERNLYFLCLIVQIACGWFVTAAFSFISWLLLFFKIQLHRHQKLTCYKQSDDINGGKL